MGIDKIMAEDGWVTITVAAKLTGLHRSTVHKHINENKVTIKKVAGKIYISKTELAKLYPEPISTRILQNN